MIKTYLTYSRDAGDFKFDLVALSQNGLSGIRLINKGKTAEEFTDRIAEILAYGKKNNLELEILVDLPGEKALIGNVGKGIQIEKGEVYQLCSENQEEKSSDIPTTGFLSQLDPEIVRAGDVISIADGELDMKILEVMKTSVNCEALNSFFLTSNRSFTIKGNKLPVQPVSNHDKILLESLQPAAFSGPVKILVSFISDVSHVEYVRQLVPGFHIVSKVETLIPSEKLEEIIRASDSIMLGRGDLTSTSKMSEVFPFQKEVIRLCNSYQKELILATGLFGDLKNSGKPSISDMMDFGFLRNQDVSAFLIAGSNANQYPFETLDLITNFENLD
ncbi:pyruvate kinase [Fluviicola sp.]|uniref:pyruvate kinase n=1 Tax=Fluviicola sp. TaxID=1917219 RepID=UPI0031D93C69